MQITFPAVSYRKANAAARQVKGVNCITWAYADHPVDTLAIVLTALGYEHPGPDMRVAA